ncbi:MAG: nuclear transport factor 2 family protein [Acidobacteriota bacterium]
MPVRLYTAFAALTLVAAAVRAGAAPAESTLLELDATLQRAVLKQDVTTLGELLSDDWILTTSSGKVVSKAAFLAAVADSKQRLDVNTSSEVEVRQHGDTAIVTAVLHERGSVDGKPHDAWVRYTDTWVREGGVWHYVAAHACRLAGPPSSPAR